MRPIATTVPTAVCAIAPNTSDAATVVTASEPRTPPTSDITQTTTRRAMPPCAMMSPASTKNGTANSGKLSSPLNRNVCMVSVGTSATNSTTTRQVTSSTRKIGTPSTRRTAGRTK
jgi:hypothetical protein